MGLRDSTRRVQVRTDFSSSQQLHSNKTAVAITNLQLMAGGPEAKDHGCDISSTQTITRERSLFSFIPHNKAKWNIPSNLQSQKSEQAYSLQEIQDGNYMLSHPINSAKCVLMYHRPKRRILPCADLSTISEIPQICSSHSGGKHSLFSVQSSPVRDLVRPKDLFKNHDRSSGIFEIQESGGDSISGRPTDNWSDRTGTYTAQESNDYYPATTRLVHKLGEIKTDTQQKHNIPRHTSKHILTDVISSSRKKGQTHSEDTPLPTTRLLHNKRSHENVGADDGLHTICSMESKSYSKIPVLDFRGLGQELPPSRPEYPTTSKSQNVPELVDRHVTFNERNTLASMANQSNPNRCQSVRLGCKSRRQTSSGSVDCLHSKSVLKLPRTKSGMGDLEKQCLRTQRTSCESLLRQYNNSGLLETPRGHKEQRSPGVIGKDFLLGRKIYPLVESDPSKRRKQQGGGFLKPESPRSKQVVSERQRIPRDNQGLGSSDDRFICYQDQFQSRKFLLAGQHRVRPSDGRIQSGLGRSSYVCFSSYSTDFQSHTKDSGGQGHCNPNSAILAEKELVPSPKRNGSSRTDNSTCQRRSPVPRSHLSPKPTVSQSLGLDPERSLLKSRGLSDKVITTMKASRKPVTFAIYNKIWKKFMSFCGSSQPNQTSPNISQILDFLQSGFDKGLKTSTLKVQISALSAFFDHPLADNRWISRFVKATSRLRPNYIQKIPSWDLSLVLNYLTGPPFEPMEDANIKDLTQKLTFLIAITSARRLGEIQALSIREPYLRISEDRVTLRLDKTFVPKVSSEFHRNQEIFLPSFFQDPKSPKEATWHSLDVRRILLHYIKNTESWRQDSNILLQFGNKNKGKKASKASIARWIQLIIKGAYESQNLTIPERVRAHSTRAMATTWAEKRGASIEEICRAATWSNQLTFAKHYRLNIQNTKELAFGRKVLQTVVPP
ncbi:uncharacterized protein [Engystomops pustulosus]|uniref:uncharacterized protein isoform X1 n=1 Tax=Engystomops pustulosus TaxID=76066 RepID=UPI003AFAE251